MNQKYNFRQSQEFLQVDPKTFGRWLVEAKIDPKKQVNRADPRQKWLTEEQIIMLAREHDRPPPSFPKEDEPESPGVTLATVAEQLTAIEQLITQRFTDMPRDLANLEQRITLITQGSQVEVKSPTAPPIRKPIATRKSTKKTARGKRLPKNLVPLAAFRAEHGISQKAVEYAVEKNKITVERGKWVHDNKNVVIAVGQLGQHEFYTLFSARRVQERIRIAFRVSSGMNRPTSREKENPQKFLRQRALSAHVKRIEPSDNRVALLSSVCAHSLFRKVQVVKLATVWVQGTLLYRTFEMHSQAILAIFHRWIRIHHHI